MAERLWLANNGSYQVVASYVCLIKDNRVKLRKENGAIIAVPLNLLCEEDIAFITTQSRHLTMEPNPDEANISTGVEYETLGSSADCQLNNTPSTTQRSLRCISKTPENANVRHMTLDESRKMIPNRSLSSITEQFKRQTFIENPWTDKMNLAYLPRRVIGQLFNILDVSSKAQLAVVSHRFYPFISKPASWETLWFVQQQTVDDLFFHRLVAFLQHLGLHKAVKHIFLDKTRVTSESISYAIKCLENLETLSIQSCWKVFTYDLALELTELAKDIPRHKSKLTQVSIGKVLNRGPSHELKEIIESKSFGQDVWIINSALNRLTNKNVVFDVALCKTCHIGASAYEFVCVSCGILPLLKCVGCAPKCDR
ncbi:hypothetical protein BY458DRAFT_518576 [Sporodiniella umbellata]|nr:hypothetical protein BY458DRAFT_518576 [Sporodiniella umbellata]